MRQRRFLAPWHREMARQGWGEEAGAGAEVLSSFPAGDLAGLRGKPAIYHCISRVVNREQVFGREEKEEFVRLMRLYERFCQVKVLTFCVMGNHFHLLLEVPAAPVDGGASWSDERLLEHLGGLYSRVQLGKIRWELGHYREQGNGAAAGELRQRYFARMWDLSAYMKVLKQRFTQWFNRRHGRRGVLWEDRFKSVLVEDGHAARTVAAYIDLNPVRAGLVRDPKDYRWCGYAEALAGQKPAREGLRRVVYEELAAAGSERAAAEAVASWREVVRRYRVVLFEDGERRERDRAKRRGGLSPRRVAQVLASGGRLSEAEFLRCRVRYFVDGLVIGSAGFVEGVFRETRAYFGGRRRDGARRMRRVETELRTMRDLQHEALG